MNANQLINMVFRLFLRRAIHKGIDAGIGMASKRRKGAGDTAEGRDQTAAGARQSSKRARQALRLGRRIGRP